VLTDGRPPAETRVMETAALLIRCEGEALGNKSGQRTNPAGRSSFLIRTQKLIEPHRCPGLRYRCARWLPAPAGSLRLERPNWPPGRPDLSYDY
jgi:hypothetical protein